MLVGIICCVIALGPLKVNRRKIHPYIGFRAKLPGEFSKVDRYGVRHSYVEETTINPEMMWPGLALCLFISGKVACGFRARLSTIRFLPECLLVLALCNLGLYLGGVWMLGGSALIGTVWHGWYYVGNHRTFTEVSQTAWIYIEAHGLVTLAAIALSLATYARVRVNRRRRAPRAVAVDSSSPVAGAP